MSKDLYIARQIALVEQCVGFRIDAERIFTNFDSAREWCKSMEEAESSDSDDCFRNVIRRFSFDENANAFSDTYEYWEYSTDGVLRDSYPRDDEAHIEYKEFEIGSIVLIRSNIQRRESIFVKPKIGLILDSTKVEATSGNGSDGYFEYVLIFVGESGLLDHIHLPCWCLHEISDLTGYDSKFLLLYSKYLQGKLSDEVGSLVARALRDDVFVNSPSFWALPEIVKAEILH